MAQIKDVVINITKLTQNFATSGFGMPLIVATNETKAYKEYSRLSEVSPDYESTTDAYKMAAAFFEQKPTPKKIAIVGVLYEDDPADITAALNLVAAKFTDWLYLLCDMRAQPIISALETWAVANDKLYFTTINKADLATATASKENTVVMVHDVPTSFPECGWVGKCSTYMPGSATWKFKTIAGIDAVPYDDQEVEVSAIHEKNYNTYITKYGIKQTSEGLCANGEYIDIVLGIRWLKARMEERINTILVNSPKISFDAEGIALIVSAVSETLKEAVSNGIIRKDSDGNAEYSIEVPSMDDISATDIAARTLNGISWNAKLAGAIHEVEINGVVQY